jgi:large subunit ribosomal protein L5
VTANIVTRNKETMAEKQQKKAAPKADSKAKGEKKGKGGGDAAEVAHSNRPAPPARLQEKYRETVIPTMMKRFNYDNVNQVPRIEKIAINVGVGQAASDPKLLEAAVRDLEAIAGQKAAITKAKKSISNVKLRENQAIGARVTLRRARMYEFLDRLMTTAIPRIRDFRGIPDKSFDGRGNYTLGVREQIIFPEIDVDKVSRITGMDITFATSAQTDEEALELLKAFGLPFRKRETEAQAA